MLLPPATGCRARLPAAIVAAMGYRVICALVAVSLSCSRGGPATQPPQPPGDSASVAQGDRVLEPGEVIDLGAIDSTAGLSHLLPLVEDARVVIVGEATHADGASVHAISRMVRFLHEQAGFEVFAVESGLYDCAIAQQRAQAGATGEEVANACAFRTFRELEPAGELWDYLASAAATESPLILAGFDNQFSGARGPAFVDDLAAVLEAHGVGDRLDDSWRRDMDDAMTKLAPSPPPDRTPEQRERHRAAIAQALEALRASEISGGYERAKWLRILEGLAAEDQSRWLYQHEGHTDEDMNLRDEQMARNLIWLLTERYPDKRFVVWAATMHNVRNPTLLGQLDHGSHMHDFADFRPAGDWLVSELPELDVVSIGFVGLTGTRGWPGSERSTALPEPTARSFEAAALATNIDYGLVDLRAHRGFAHWLAGSFSAGVVGPPMEAPWGRVIDAIAFIRTMTPNQAVGSAIDR